MEKAHGPNNIGPAPAASQNTHRHHFILARSVASPPTPQPVRVAGGRRNPSRPSGRRTLEQPPARLRPLPPLRGSGGFHGGGGPGQQGSTPRSDAAGRFRGRGTAPAPPDTEEQSTDLAGVGVGRGRGTANRPYLPIGKKKLVTRGKIAPVLQLNWNS